MVVTVY